MTAEEIFKMVGAVNGASFILSFVNELEKNLPEKYRDYKVTMEKVYRNNMVDTSIIVSPKKKEGNNAMACGGVFWVSDLLAMYEPEMGMEKIVQYAVRSLERTPEVNIEAVENLFSDPEWFLQVVRMRIINTKKNADRLKKLVHRDFLDLSVVYHVPVNVGEEEGYILIETEHVKKLGLTEEQLYRSALDNTEKNAAISSLYSIIAEITGDAETQGQPCGVMVVTNAERHYGAVCMVSTNVLDRAAATCGNSDLYILPSSVDEVLVLPTASADLSVLKSMVCEVNSTVVEEKDLLSDSVYFYDKTLKTVTKIA